MAKAKKLPSGSWRCLVYSHSIPAFNKDGSPKLDISGNLIHKRIYESFTSDDPGPSGKREAEFLAAEFANEKQRRSRADSLTVIEAINKYIEAKSNVLAPGTVKEYKRMRSAYYQSISGIPLKNINSEILQSWVNLISVSLNPKTVRNAHGLLSAAFDMFYPDLRIKTTLPKKKKPNLYVPSDDDVKKLLNHVRGRELEIAILLAALGPMRRGEICALESTDIKGNIVSVNKSMGITESGDWKIKQPKTYSSYREIEYPDYVIGKIQHINGKIIKATPDQITSRFRRAIKFSGVPTFRFHDLRHYAASIMHAIGVPDQYIIARGGWATDNVMKSVYRGVIDSETKKVNEKIFEHFSSMQHEMQHEQ